MTKFTSHYESHQSEATESATAQARMDVNQSSKCYLGSAHSVIDDNRNFRFSDVTANMADLVQKIGLWKTINAAVSCPALGELRRAILTSEVVLIHDNACSLNAVVTRQLLEQFKWDVSNHPAYSPNIVTSDFHFFPELKN
ncbi:hypothetical protein AVEN_248668-1 [Araneus ventricosus]|uniref:Histone-lysine N-methyltransferase SETMAR n=1 Tax=Araneus ventricosus TaxID=182803 RepID=A0A4Y2C1T7_ARAVE|nr:hypothetical protein AVEN_248668-1 [Araneus ventricosus]